MSTNASKAGQTLTKLAVALIVLVIASFAVIKSFSTTDSDPALLTQEAIEDRIAPVARYNTGAPAIVLGGDENKGPLTGEEVYKKLCMSCHDAGIAGAPKTGDNAAWAPRIAQGEATVYKHAIEGLNGMPARGGDPNLSDLEVQRAVVYMINASGGNFVEPAAEGEAAPAQEEAKAEEAPAATTEAAPAQEEAKAEEAPAVATEAAPVAVDADKALALANAKACMACHTVETKVIGPSYKEVAAKYGDDVSAIVGSIKDGSTGKWGPIPMAPNAVTAEEAELLAAWILSFK